MDENTPKGNPVATCTIDQMKRQQNVLKATIGTSKKDTPVLFFGTVMVTIGSTINFEDVKKDPKQFIIRRYENPESIDGTGLTSILGKAICQMTDEEL